MAENRRPETGVNSLTFTLHQQRKTDNESSSGTESDEAFNTRALRATQNTLLDNSSPATPALRQARRIDFAQLAAARTPRGSARRPHRPKTVTVAEEEAAERERAALELGTQRLQLISPPPEETLSLRRHSRVSSGGLGTPGPEATAKRKRAAVGAQVVSVDAEAMEVEPSTSQRQEEAVQATPNPKPRKMRHVRSEDSPTQGSPARSTTPTRPRHSVVQSPYAKNPEADWIPPLPATALLTAPARRAVLGSRGSRRSATPIPAYEPPTDVFTPPKMVFLTPRPVEGRRTPATARKSTRKPRASSVLRVDTVKQELPDNIDLLAPMPPPSPSDDPLLLSGPPESSPLGGAARRREGKARWIAPVLEDVETADMDDMDGELPPSSEPPLDSEDTRAASAFAFDAPGSLDTEDSMMHVDPADADVLPVRLFGDGESGWSDSDEEMGGVVDEGEGEYTGRWRTLRIPTKQDPPSSATRERMARWGRPISPFPDLAAHTVDEEVAQSQEEELLEEEEVLEMSLRVDDEEEEEEVQQLDEEQDEVLEPKAPSPPPTVNALAHDSAPDVEKDDVLLDPEAPAPPSEEVQQLDEEQDEVLPDPKAPSPPTVNALAYDSAPEVEKDDGDSADDEAGFVKITSSDPRAAARAAAILKQHDYECYTKLLLKKQRRGVEDIARNSRRRDLSSAGITKSSVKKRINIIDDQVFIPGTPVTTLPALLQEAEKEVVREFEHQQTPTRVWAARATIDGSVQRSLFKTPARPSLPAQLTPMPIPVPIYNPAGERVWTKDEWRLLDACFTDERLDVAEGLPGAEQGALAPVDMINMDHVVSRFVSMLGGKDLVEKWGEAWEHEDLLERARALQNKQRAGRVARPSTPRLFSPGFSFSASRPSSMQVPDFTPLFNRRAAPHPRKSKASSPPLVSALPPRPAFPSPVTHNAPFSSIRDDRDDEDAHTPHRVPRTLLAPRYSHLLEEAVRVSQEGTLKASNSSSNEHEEQQTHNCPNTPEHNTPVADAPHTPSVTAPVQVPPPSLGKRVKGFLFSYLPTRGAKPAPSAIPSRAGRPTRPGLPLPPPAVLARPRGPVATPARPPVRRAPAPKDLVALHPAPPPAPSTAAAATNPPRRLVALAHVPAPVEKPVVARDCPPRPRRSSGSSVRELVQGFEAMERGAARVRAPPRMTTSAATSTNALRARWKAAQPDGRPRWK